MFLVLYDCIDVTYLYSLQITKLIWERLLKLTVNNKKGQGEISNFPSVLHQVFPEFPLFVRG